MDLEKILNNEESQKKEEQPRFIVRDAKYALRPQPPLEWIVDKLITEGSVSVFYGEPGSKKTYSLLSLAVCVALGKPWLGFMVKQMKVLIIDEESGERRFTLRLGAAIRGEFGDESTPIEFVSLAEFKLDNEGDVEMVLELIQKRGAGLVIIDALADVMDGDENSKQDTQPVLNKLRKIAVITNAAIIVIHHSNKSGGYRGSSAIKGALDLMIKIQSDDGSQFIKFKSEKTRDSGAVEFSAEAHWSGDQFYLTEVEYKEDTKRLSRSEKFVMGFLKENPASPIPEIMGAADICSAEAARRAVYKLAESGLVYRTNPKDRGRGVAAIYDLTNEGKEYEIE
jgi:RecA-family ATPase